MTAPTWRLLRTPDVPAAFAMGLDEALLLAADEPPTLRLYTWAPDALSLGYFQPSEEVPAASAHPNVVRRITGGGAIHHHAAELTFSVTLGAEDPAYAGSVPESYGRTHRAVALALQRLGADGARERGDEACRSDQKGTGMCFHESTPLDVGWGPAGGGFAKGVGTAQRRTRGRILHHGSIKVGPSPLEPGVATLAETDGARPDLEALGDELVRAFAEVHGVALVPGAVSEERLTEAERLGERYGAPEFVNRRIRR
ncbi:MAG: hypothetical protein AAFZ87_13020 [Planctomycetota bacterium]